MVRRHSTYPYAGDDRPSARWSRVTALGASAKQVCDPTGDVSIALDA
jgi:hypothetical protein